MFHKSTDWLYNGPIGRWVDKHPAPPWWVSFVLSLASIGISLLALSR